MTFNVIVKDVSPKSIPWKVNPSTITLERLLSHIQVSFPNLNRDRRDIVIEHTESAFFPQGGVANLSTDAGLQENLKAYVIAGLDTIAVHVVFRRKGFSHFSMLDITARVGKGHFDEMELGTIDCSEGIYLEALQKLWISIGLARDSIGANSEACMTRYSGGFFMAAVTLYPELHLVPEKPISGSWGSGPVDYLVETRDALELSMVGVVEAKKQSTFKTGFPQNVAQLEATLTMRMEHDCRRNGKSMDLLSHGIVTDANRWEFIECRMVAANAKCINQQLVVRRSSLEITIDYSDDRNWKDQVKTVFEHVVWLFSKMSQSAISSKRMKESREP